MKLLGDRPERFHVVSLVLHWLCALMLAALFVRAFRDFLPGAGAAVIFAIAPANMVDVGWISAQGDLLYTLTMLLGLLVYHEALRSGCLKIFSRYTALGACAVLTGLFFKESAVVGPILMIMLGLAVRHRSKTAEDDGDSREMISSSLRWWDILKPALVPLSVAVAYFIVRFSLPTPEYVHPVEHGHLAHLMLAGPWKLLLKPLLFLNAFVFMTPLAQVGAISVTGGLIATTCCAYVGLGWLCFRMRENPIALLGLAWFFTALAPTTPAPAYSHHIYAASAGLSLFVWVAILNVWRAGGGRDSKWLGSAFHLLLLAVVAIAIRGAVDKSGQGIPVFSAPAAALGFAGQAYTAAVTSVLLRRTEAVPVVSDTVPFPGPVGMRMSWPATFSSVLPRLVMVWSMVTYRLPA